MVRSARERKSALRDKLLECLRNYKTIIVATANHVGSHHLQKIRLQLRGLAVVLMGKNTLIRNVLRQYQQEDPTIEQFIPCVKGNCGFIFTNEDVNKIQKMIVNNTIESSARPGVFAPNDVSVPSGPTGLDPGQTEFFQVLNIATKIFKGQIEITSNVDLIRKGQKVGNSEAALLDKLGIKPFRYGLLTQSIFTEGSAFSPEILDLTETDLISKFMSAVRLTAALGISLGIPNLASIPHSFSNALKKLIAISVQTDYTFDASAKYKEFLENPDAFIVKKEDNGEEAAKEDNGDAKEKEEEEEESSDHEGGMGGLFGDDSDSE